MSLRAAIRRAVRMGISGAVLVLATPALAAGSQVTVCDAGCDYPTISAALGAASSGDVVQVAPGTYAENLVIDRDVAIQGAGSGLTTIAVSGPGSGIQVTGGVVRLEGISVTPADSANRAAVNIEITPPARDGDYELRDVVSTGSQGTNLLITGGGVASHLLIADSAITDGGAANVHLGPAVTLLDATVLRSDFSRAGQITTGTNYPLFSYGMHLEGDVVDLLIDQSSFDDNRSGGLMIEGGLTGQSVIRAVSADRNGSPDAGKTRAGIMIAPSRSGGAVASGLLIDDVQITSSAGRALALVADGDNSVSDVTVRGATINGAGGPGILITSSGTGTGRLSGVRIEGADISGTTGSGVRVEASGRTVSDVDVATSDIAAPGASDAIHYTATAGGAFAGANLIEAVEVVGITSGYSGVRVYGPVPGAVDVRGSSLTGSGYGVRYSGGGALVTATGNWWGCPAGPAGITCATTLAGTGTIDATSWISAFTENPFLAGAPGFWPMDLSYRGAVAAGDLVMAFDAPTYGYPVIERVAGGAAWGAMLSAGVNPVAGGAPGDTPFAPGSWLAELTDDGRAGTITLCRDGDATADVMWHFTGGAWRDVTDISSSGVGRICGRLDETGVIAIGPAKDATAVSVSQAEEVTTVGGAAAFAVRVAREITPAGDTTPVPGGQVTISHDAGVIGDCTLDEVGACTVRTSALAVGLHTLRARYAGDADHAPSLSSAISHRVERITSTLALTQSQLQSTPGEAIALSIRLTPSTATGAVTLRTQDGAALGACTPADGQCTVSASSLPVGDWTITAHYPGDERHTASTSDPVAHQVRAKVLPMAGLIASPSVRGAGARVDAIYRLRFREAGMMTFAFERPRSDGTRERIILRRGTRLEARVLRRSMYAPVMRVEAGGTMRLVLRINRPLPAGTQLRLVLRTADGQIRQMVIPFSATPGQAP